MDLTAGLPACGRGVCLGARVATEGREARCRVAELAALDRLSDLLERLDGL